MKKINWLLLAALSLMAIFISCLNDFTPPHSGETPLLAEGKGRVEITIAGTNARTLFPDIDGLTYNLSIIQSGMSIPVVNETLDSSLSWTGDLNIGTYTVTVIGYETTIASAAVRGTESLSVASGEISSVEIVLTYTEISEGNLGYAVSVPETITFLKGELQIETIFGTDSYSPIDFAVSGMSGSIVLPSGYYRLIVRIIGTDEEQKVFYKTATTAHITGGITTKAIYDLTKENFNYAEICTVTFDLNYDEAPIVEPQELLYGEKAVKPAPVRDGFVFLGWYADNNTYNTKWNFNTDIVIGNITLYACWVNSAIFDSTYTVSNSTELNDVLADIEELNFYEFVIIVTNSFSTNPIDLTSMGFSSKSIAIKSLDNADYEITLARNGSLFTIGADVELVVENLTLRGRSNSTSLVRVNQDGKLVLNREGKIIGNTFSSDTGAFGGGVYISGGSFAMYSGEISGNATTTRITSTSTSGGGVYIVDGGSFTMYSGEISNNSASRGGGEYSVARGGGVCISGGTFTMHDGKISGNTASYGGGVYGTVTMYGGEISGNTVSGSSTYGGGVSGTVYMHGGEISGNSASGSTAYNSPFGFTASGGGVSGSVFISTGVIYGSNAAAGLANNASSSGAALYRGSGTTAQYGTFSGDTFTANGDLGTTNDTIRVVDGILE